MIVLANALPVLMAVESVVAAGIYLLTGNWQHAGYWFSAAAITFFVTMMGG